MIAIALSSSDEAMLILGGGPLLGALVFVCLIIRDIYRRNEQHREMVAKQKAGMCPHGRPITQECPQCANRAGTGKEAFNL